MGKITKMLESFIIIENVSLIEKLESEVYMVPVPQVCLTLSSMLEVTHKILLLV